MRFLRLFRVVDADIVLGGVLLDGLEADSYQVLEGTINRNTF